MNFSKLYITGHQRAGTHYAAAVVSLNFMGSPDYKKIYLNHKLPDIVKYKNTAYLFVRRNFQDTARSVFNMRGRFGLQVEDFNVFLKNKYYQMWKPVPYGGIRVVDLDGTVRKKEMVSNYFKKIKHTPKEWWTRYYKSWNRAERKKNNVFMVDYDGLINDFDSEMGKLASLLGCPKPMSGFKNIERKIGWIP